MSKEFLKFQKPQNKVRGYKSLPQKMIAIEGDIMKFFIKN